MPKHVQKKNIVKQPVAQKIQTKNQPAAKKTVNSEALSWLNNFFEKNIQKVFYFCLGFTVLFGILLFDAKISEGGDDSEYILSAKDFIEGIRFPTWHGTLYPIFLSIPVAIFGINLMLFKILSFILMILNLVFLYKTFKDKLKPIILAPVLIFMSINQWVLYFCSSTYSESLFFFIQAISFYYFLKLLTKIEDQPNSIKKHWTGWLLCGFLFTLLSLTRNIGLGMALSGVIFLLIYKKYLPALFLILGFLAFQIPYNIYKNVAWASKGSGYESQLSQMFYVHPYDKSKGKENFGGFVTRVVDNSNIYLSRHLLKFLGFKKPESLKNTPIMSIVFYAFFILGFYWCIKDKNKILIFIALYTTICIGVTFISQQALWGQERLILVYLPFILMILFYGIYKTLISAKLKTFNFLYPVMLVIFFFSIMGQTMAKVSKNTRILSKNLSGDMLYGFTPDWVHFLEASKWAAKSLPVDSVIASRKPSMSYIYGQGRKFFGIFKFNNINTDSLLYNLNKKKEKSYIIELHSSLQKQGKTRTLNDMITKYNSWIINQSGKAIYVFLKIPETDTLEAIKNLNNLQIEYYTSHDVLRNKINKVNMPHYAANPDTLKNYFVKNKIAYVIDARLRKYTAKKTTEIINTIYRYLFFIEIKYPRSFVRLHQSGKDEDEPAFVYQFIKQ